jgi:hypothetical protein
VQRTRIQNKKPWYIALSERFGLVQGGRQDANAVIFYMGDYPAHRTDEQGM